MWQRRAATSPRQTWGPTSPHTETIPHTDGPCAVLCGEGRATTDSPTWRLSPACGQGMARALPGGLANERVDRARAASRSSTARSGPGAHPRWARRRHSCHRRAWPHPSCRARRASAPSRRTAVKSLSQHAYRFDSNNATTRLLCKSKFANSVMTVTSRPHWSPRSEERL